ncbi:DNA cross-link repair protein SNM1 [Capsicum annuum]|uniref:DNA cross-link repair protein SNM1 n=1 Tax=Capsicum annuum TaxID=4072 RepID=A0A1U8FZF8_CAPAN|nr:DNA cross-link repair protein SNM1 [Capsicum annuum]PHT92110.1 DNA cross-link repair protein SNM1 [Capsicum annuum]
METKRSDVEEWKKKKKRKRVTMKQKNLFELWGLKDPHPKPPDPDDVQQSRAAAASPLNCPFYKKIPAGTPFTVDAFRYAPVKACSAYFLTHFHADHYIGLTKSWSHAPIYCTNLTARLLNISLYVAPSFICPLELGTEYNIKGIKVTMLDANHCPGAALIHFRLPNGQSYLHTGDFRASKLMQSYPLLATQRINLLYLDTTYCNPKYRFPSKEDVLEFVVGVTRRYLNNHPKTIVVVGAYTIGKEQVYLAISQALGVKIYANASRRRILRSFGWAGISENLSTNGKDTPLHILPISSLRFEVLQRYLESQYGQYTSMLAFRPTGWTYSETIGENLNLIKPTSKGNITIYGVPYSEHSNFTELQEFVQFLRPEKIIPTVNVGNPVNRGKMQSYFQQWLKA